MSMKGTVVKSYGKYYTVEYEGKRLNCTLRGRLRKDKRLEKYSEAVAVGDLVISSLTARTAAP